MAATIKVSVPRDLAGKVADKESRDGGNKFGKATGLRKVHFADAMLRANATACATDEVLAATFAAEFPKAEVHQPIPAWRGYFNQGLHGLNPDRKYHSVSYNEEGEARRKATPKATKGGKAKKATKKATKATKATKASE